MNKAMSYAGFRFLLHRFKNSPGAKYTRQWLNVLFDEMGYDSTYRSTKWQTGDAAALGNFMAQRWIAFGLQDGANEVKHYKNQFYRPVNDALLPVGPGNQMLTDPNRWQPLTFDQFIDQSGNLIPGNVPEFQNAEWGQVAPFALPREERHVNRKDGYDYVYYFDPGRPPYLDSTNHQSTRFYQWGFTLVAQWAAHHDLEDGETIDISPANFGNIGSYPQAMEDYPTFYQWPSCLGAGYSENPITRKPYKRQWVNRGDFTRVLAEFWADGPRSETPPGHWFTILNYVADHPQFVRKWEGRGNEMGEVEWYVKSYLALGGALHDAAIVAWGLKGYYDYVRPISAIRYMAQLGQSSDRGLPRYHPWGIPLKKGFCELVKPGDPLAGDQNQNVHKVKLWTWRGPRYITEPKTELAGVGWILAENWWPYQRPTFITPPFAGFVSGHSTYSSAAAEVITRITGSPFFPGGMGEFRAKKNRYLVFEEGPSSDVVLQWARYKDAADQSALSRIWGGIHPPQDDLPGREIGKSVGGSAFDKATKLFAAR